MQQERLEKIQLPENLINKISEKDYNEFVNTFLQTILNEEYDLDKMIDEYGEFATGVMLSSNYTINDFDKQTIDVLIKQCNDFIHEAWPIMELASTKGYCWTNAAIDFYHSRQSVDMGFISVLSLMGINMENLGRFLQEIATVENSIITIDINNRQNIVVKDLRPKFKLSSIYKAFWEKNKLENINTLSPSLRDGGVGKTKNRL